MMVKITKLYILISVVWPWLSFKVTVSWEIQDLGVHFVANLGIDLDEIQYVATACWFVEAHAKFILNKYYSPERTLPTWFYEISVEHHHVPGHLNLFVSNLVWY